MGVISPVRPLDIVGRSGIRMLKHNERTLLATAVTSNQFGGIVGDWGIALNEPICQFSVYGDCEVRTSSEAGFDIEQP